MAEKVGELLADTRKREIVLLIYRDGPKRYNQFMKELNMTSGNLNHFLNKLQIGRYVQKNNDGAYSLTEVANKIIPIVEMVLKEASRL